MTWEFVTTCVDARGEDINEMNDAAVEVTYRTFRRVVGQVFVDRQAVLGYDVGNERGGLRMSKDWAVSYWKSTYRGRPCYFFRWSHIEQIFQPREP